MSTLCEKRLAICHKCPLCKKTWDGGWRCDSSKYINEDGTQTSFLPKKGWIKGCNCRVDIKCQNENATCVRGLW